MLSLLTNVMNAFCRQRRSFPWATVLACVLVTSAYQLSAAEALLPPLTSVSGNPRLPGKFIWADLVTDNVGSARNFYGKLFGWQFMNAGDYLIAINDSHPIAGMFQKSRPPNDPKAKPRWIGYISVPDVKNAEKRVTKAGGRVIAARQQFPDRGEQAVCADAEGALFGVMRTSGGDPEDFLAEPGDWIWIQLLSRDAQKAGEFYRAVANYEVIENTSANRLNDHVLVSKGFARGTIRTITRTDVNPIWLPYIHVKNVSETVSKAKELGGTILVEPKADLLDGKVAVIADPTGAAVGILAWHPSQEGK